MHFTAPQIVLPDQALPLLAFNATTMSELIRRASYWVPDYSWIRQTQGESKPITPKKTVEHHELSLPWLNKELQIGHAGSTVVVKRLIASKGKKLKESIRAVSENKSNVANSYCQPPRSLAILREHSQNKQESMNDTKSEKLKRTTVRELSAIELKRLAYPELVISAEKSSANDESAKQRMGLRKRHSVQTSCKNCMKFERSHRQRMPEGLSGSANQQIATDLAHELATGLTESDFHNCATAAQEAYHFVIRV